MVHVVAVALGLLAAAAVLGLVARRTGLPLPSVLVIGGLALGAVPGIPTVRLDPQVVLLGFLPPLVYASAFRAAPLDLRASVPHIVTLAVGLVVVTLAAVALVGHYVAGLPWVPAFVLGALVAPTDPVSASAIVRRVGAPERIVAILEGEALVNDGTGLAAFQVAVAAAGAGAFSLVQGIGTFAAISAGGTAVGLGAGWLAVRLRRRVDGLAAEVALGLAAAFSSYETAQAAGFSGVLAAVACGLYVGRTAVREGPDPARRAEPFWAGLGHLLESLLFLLIGLQLLPVVHGLPGSTAWTPIAEAAAVLGAAIVVRFAWMFTVGRFLSSVGRALPAHVERLGPAELGVLGFCGMRGALSLAGALSIPLLAAGRSFPARDEVIFLVYAVVLGTLIVPSFTLERLVRRLGLARAPRLGPER